MNSKILLRGIKFSILNSNIINKNKNDLVIMLVM